MIIFANITGIWCAFYLGGVENNLKKKLEIIKPLISLSDSDNIKIYNHWAQRAHYQQIDLKHDNLLN